MERFTMLVAVHLFLLKGDKILLLRRKNTGYCDGDYSVIAGHVDGGESAIAAMRREALEEANVVIGKDDMKIVQVMHRNCGDHERIDYFMAAKSWSGEPKNNEPDKCDDLSWFPICELPKNMVDYVRTAIDNYVHGKQFTFFGWQYTQLSDNFIHEWNGD